MTFLMHQLDNILNQKLLLKLMIEAFCKKMFIEIENLEKILLLEEKLKKTHTIVK